MEEEEEEDGEEEKAMEEEEGEDAIDMMVVGWIDISLAEAMAIYYYMAMAMAMAGNRAPNRKAKDTSFFTSGFCPLPLSLTEEMGCAQKWRLDGVFAKFFE